MSDYMLLEYLRNRDKHQDDKALIEEFKHYMKAKGKMRSTRRHKDMFWDDDYTHRDWDMDFHDIHKSGGYLRDRMSEESFDEYEAKEIVSEMFHYENNRRHTGEHFDMKKAEEVFNKYKDHFVVKASPCDVYIAINAMYHDFVSLLKTWFGSSIDEKIIMLAITFWFKDDDYQGNKLMEYFN